MKNRSHQEFTLIEFLIVVTLVVILFSMFMPHVHRTPVSAYQTKQINNVKQITLACALFASDNAGAFPNGHYDPTLGKITDTTPAASAEACFDDLFRSKKLEVEKIFWTPQHPTQCSPGTPDELAPLAANENGWDYIAGLTNRSSPLLPLAFEASDVGTGTHWTEAGGHPWEDVVIVGYVDASAEKFELTKDGQAKTKRGGTEVDLCVPTPGKNKWPDTAILAPATPTGN